MEGIGWDADLGTLGGGGERYVSAINDHDQVVGVAPTCVIWLPGPELNSAPPPQINNEGQVVGAFRRAAVWPATGQLRAFRWTAAGGMQELGTPGRSGESFAASINRWGEVVGWSDAGSGERASRRSPASRMQDLGSLGGVGTTSAKKINDRGQVTGTATTASGSHHTYRWTASGGIQDLCTLGGPWSSPAAINSSGQITGVAAVTSVDLGHATLWSSCCRNHR